MLYPDKPALYVVATPIGNLDEASPRCRHVLQAVDIIAAEDTRVARRLLTAFGIAGKELVSYHDHIEEARSAQLVERMRQQSLTVAIVSDAGTPCVADPGYRLVAAAHAAGIPVHPIAGPSSLTALVSAAGLPTDRVLFTGFLPSRTSALRQEVQGWQRYGALSLVFFESLRRLPKTLGAVEEVYPEARIAIGRELTKMFEEVRLFTVAEARHWLKNEATLKGEVAVMVHLPAPAAATAAEVQEEHLQVGSELRGKLTAGFRSGKTLKELLREYRDCGLARGALYQLLLEVKNELGL